MFFKKKGDSKPKLRGHLHNQIKTNLISAIAVAGIGAFLFRVLYVNRRRRDYEEFYSCYDPEESYKRMISKGVMTSIEENP